MRLLKCVWGVALLLGFVFLASCQTKYQEGDLTGGVRSLQIANDTYRVSSQGNGYTSHSTIQDYVLLKAAETALQNGHTHFSIINDTDRTQNEQIETATTANVIGDTIHFRPRRTINVVKPGQDTMVRIFTPAQDEKVPFNSYNAQEVFNAINPRVKRPKKKTS